MLPVIEWEEDAHELLEDNVPFLVNSTDWTPPISGFKELFNLPLDSKVTIHCSHKCSKSSTLRNFLEKNDICEDKDTSCSPLYLKDWHAKHDGLIGIYEKPKAMRDDWIEGFFASDAGRTVGDGSDYAFLYAGYQNTKTLLHHDVMSSYSWSVNISGSKRWVLFPPHVTHALDGISDIDLDSTEEFVQIAMPASITIFQPTGMVMFVPSGWHHQVWNLEDTLSLNQNWANGYNIGIMWSALHARYLDVVESISDCKEFIDTEEEWQNECQKMLLLLHGIDIPGFIRIVEWGLEHSHTYPKPLLTNIYNILSEAQETLLLTGSYP